jgi:hypothetical protein
MSRQEGSGQAERLQRLHGGSEHLQSLLNRQQLPRQDQLGSSSLARIGFAVEVWDEDALGVRAGCDL